MDKNERDRVMKNRKCISIMSKPLEEISSEEKEFIKDNYSGYGSILGVEGLAQFFTPHEVSFELDNYLNKVLPINAKILEPSVGAGSLLFNLREDFQITTIDVDEMNYKLNCILHPNFENFNDSACNHKRENYYDAVIANPPFNISIEGDIDLNYKSLKYDKKTKKYKGNSDWFFLEQAINCLKVGGYGVFILSPAIKHKLQLKEIRQLLLDSCWIISHIQLPSETFENSGTTIQTNILIFRKAPKLPKFKCNSYDAISDYEWLLGQPPIVCIDVLKFDYIHEAFEMLTDELWLTNVCPENAKRSGQDEAIFFKVSDLGYKYKSRYMENVIFFETQTLGRGKEIEYEGVEYETCDWGVMDELIKKYK